MNHFLVNELKQHFKNYESFTSAELFAFFRKYEPCLKENTFRWRVYNLKESGILLSLKRGIYSLNADPSISQEQKHKFEPELSPRLKKLFVQIHTLFPDLTVCIWDTRWLNHFITHQPGLSYLVIEVQKGEEETLFSSLSDFYKQIYLKPTAKEIDLYMKDGSLVIKPLISSSPMKKRAGNCSIPHIEKILVDLLLDYNLFYLYQGKELIEIFNHINDNYAINFGRLFRYATRRGAHAKVVSFISAKTSIQLPNGRKVETRDRS